MADLTTTTASTALFSAFSLSVIFPHIDASQVLGALSGSLLLVMTQNELSTLRRICFFAISFFLGVYLADFFIQVIDYYLLPKELHSALPKGFGALVASAVSVKLLLWVIRIIDHPQVLSDIFKGKK